MRVLVTGAHGYIGRWTLQPLRDLGYEVHAISRSGRPAEGFAPRVHWHRADLLDVAAMNAVMGAVIPSHMLHLAWYTEHGAFWHAPENLQWVRASIAMTEAFVANGGRRMVMAGTCAEYDWSHGWCREAVTPRRPATLYGVAKDALWRWVEAYAAQYHGLSVAWGRVFLLYGPGEPASKLVASVILALLRGDRAATSEGLQYRDFMHVVDVARALVMTLHSDVEGAINIASGAPRQLRDVVRAIALKLSGLDRVDWGVYPSRPGDPALLAGDARRLHEEVGFRPEYSLDGGLSATIDWYRDRLGMTKEV